MFAVRLRKMVAPSEFSTISRENEVAARSVNVCKSVLAELSEEETARSFDFKEGVAEETRTRPNLVNGNAEASK